MALAGYASRRSRGPLPPSSGTRNCRCPSSSGVYGKSWGSPVVTHVFQNRLPSARVTFVVSHQLSAESSALMLPADAPATAARSTRGRETFRPGAASRCRNAESRVMRFIVCTSAQFTPAW